MLLAVLRGRFIFPARRDYVVFTIDVCCSVLTRQRVYCLLGQSPCSPQVEDVGLVLMNTVGLRYQYSMVCSTSLAVDKAGNLVTIGRFQSLSFFTVSAGSFFLSSGLAPKNRNCAEFCDKRIPGIVGRAVLPKGAWPFLSREGERNVPVSAQQSPASFPGPAVLSMAAA